MMIFYDDFHHFCLFPSVLFDYFLLIFIKCNGLTFSFWTTSMWGRVPEQQGVTADNCITRQKLRDIFVQAVVQRPADCRVVFHCQVILNVPVPVSSGVCFYSVYLYCIILPCCNDRTYWNDLWSYRFLIFSFSFWKPAGG